MPYDVSEQFGPFDGRVWMNASHQGPLPKVAIEAIERAVELKRRPYQLTTSEMFTTVPARLRTAIARLINCDGDDVILGNSASYGLHVLANGLRFEEGDEVVLVEGDFPATIFPWLPLRDRGVNIRFIQPSSTTGLTAEYLRDSLSQRSRIFCTNWVHSFTGYAVDEVALGEICRANGTKFILNASQAIGARPMDVQRVPVDAVVSCGFKWLCGPYGTGFCWIHPDLRDSMRTTQCYWLAHLTADDLKGDFLPQPRPDIGARGYEVFGTANFNNFMPWTASIEFLADLGIDQIASHDQSLISQLIQSLDPAQFDVLSPREGPARSTIAVISHRNPSYNEAIFTRLRAEGVDISLRKGNLRFSPHLYNHQRDVHRATEIMKAGRYRGWEDS